VVGGFTPSFQLIINVSFVICHDTTAYILMQIYANIKERPKISLFLTKERPKNSLLLIKERPKTSFGICPCTACFQ